MDRGIGWRRVLHWVAAVNAKRKRGVGKHLKGMLKANVMAQRRQTIYRMIAKRNSGVVPCFVCLTHVPKNLATLEHILPLSKGGTNEMANLSISHAKCNHARGNLEHTP